MKRFIRLLSLVLLIMSTSGNTLAEEKVNVVKQGTIRGRIVDTSKQILPGTLTPLCPCCHPITYLFDGSYDLLDLSFFKIKIRV